jgi:hypothetical protein
MGEYTAHWEKYKRDANKRTLKLLGFLLLVPLIALLGYGLSTLGSWGLYVTWALLFFWLLAFTRLAWASAKVPCPKCGTTYSRGKYLVNCPKCGLRMFQES